MKAGGLEKGMSSHHVYRPPKHKTCEGVSCSMAVVTIFTFVSGLILLIDGFIVARPGIPALDFKETTCIVRNKTYVGNRICECAGLTNDNPYCRSHFPCIQVIADFITINENGDNNKTNNIEQAIVHEHESIAYSKHSECSILSCEASTKGNTHKINLFLQEYGEINSKYTCFFNQYDPSIVILKKNYSRLAIILSLAIPGGTFLIMLIALIAICVAHHKNKKTKLPKPPVPRSYMNGSYVPNNENTAPANNSHELPGCCESRTYTRLEDPAPPNTYASDNC